MTYTTRMDEQDVLDYLYVMARNPDVDRIALLRQIANVRLARPSNWDRKAIRQAAWTLCKPVLMTPPLAPLTLTQPEQCWCCLNAEHRLYWHHAITVGHGGSSTPRNLIPVCHACHRRVHPWLPEPTTVENKHGWTSLTDLAGRVLEKFDKAFAQPVPRRQVHNDDLEDPF